MNKNRIKIGDTVRVFINKTTIIDGTVNYIPWDIDDIWIISDLQTNGLVYFKSFDYILLVKKKS